MSSFFLKLLLLLLLWLRRGSSWITCQKHRWGDKTAKPAWNTLKTKIYGSTLNVIKMVGRILQCFLFSIFPYCSIWPYHATSANDLNIRQMAWKIAMAWNSRNCCCLFVDFSCLFISNFAYFRTETNIYQTRTHTAYIRWLTGVKLVVMWVFYCHFK